MKLTEIIREDLILPQLRAHDRLEAIEELASFLAERHPGVSAAEAEAIQFRVPDRPACGDLVRKPLSQLDLPKGVLVGAVIRDGNALIASGSMVLQPGDELLVAFQAEALGRSEKLFS